MSRELLVILSTLSVAANASECLHYDVPTLTLQGRIVRGERRTELDHEANDRDYHWYLEFGAPICVSGAGNDTIQGALRTELLPSGSAGLETFEGRPVTVRGHFLPTYLPHYHAYLIFVAESLEVMERTPNSSSRQTPEE